MVWPNEKTKKRIAKRGTVLSTGDESKNEIFRATDEPNQKHEEPNQFSEQRMKQKSMKVVKMQEIDKKTPKSRTKSDPHPSISPAISQR